jgi:DNA-binding MarR family transcriptional regulator
VSPYEAASLDYRAIDEVIHGRVRLAIMAYLSGAGSADFGELRRKTNVTDGNLSSNLRKLEESGYITIEKRFVDRRPHTLCELTEAGRTAWLRYLQLLQEILFTKP